MYFSAKRPNNFTASLGSVCKASALDSTVAASECSDVVVRGAVVVAAKPETVAGSDAAPRRIALRTMRFMAIVCGLVSSYRGDREVVGWVWWPAMQVCLYAPWSVCHCATPRTHGTREEREMSQQEKHVTHRTFPPFLLKDVLPAKNALTLN